MATSRKRKDKCNGEVRKDKKTDIAKINKTKKVGDIGINQWKQYKV